MWRCHPKFVLPGVLTAAAWTTGCATEHSARGSRDASAPALDDSAVAHEPDARRPDAGSGPMDADADQTADTRDAEAGARDAKASVDPGRDASHITCELCLDYVNGPSLYVHNALDDSCTVLRMVWDSSCDGLDVGAGELCMTAAERWPHAASCPAIDAGTPLLAQSADGYVIGHEGIIGIGVQLAFPEEAGVMTTEIDYKECGQPLRDYRDTKPPCP